MSDPTTHHDPQQVGERPWSHGAMMALLQAGHKVRGGYHNWLLGAPTHVLAELLNELEASGWSLQPTQQDSIEEKRCETCGFDGWVPQGWERTACPDCNPPQQEQGGDADAAGRSTAEIAPVTVGASGDLGAPTETSPQQEGADEKRDPCSTGDCDREAIGEAEIEDTGWHRYCYGCMLSLAGSHDLKWDPPASPQPEAPVEAGELYSDLDIPKIRTRAEELRAAPSDAAAIRMALTGEKLPESPAPDTGEKWPEIELTRGDLRENGAPIPDADDDYVVEGYVPEYRLGQVEAIRDDWERRYQSERHFRLRRDGEINLLQGSLSELRSRLERAEKAEAQLAKVIAGCERVEAERESARRGEDEFKHQLAEIKERLEKLSHWCDSEAIEAGVDLAGARTIDGADWHSGALAALTRFEAKVGEILASSSTQHDDNQGGE